MNGVIGDILSLLEHQFKFGRHPGAAGTRASPIIVRGVEYKLQQVFLNLFLNARDAMPKGGWLSMPRASTPARPSSSSSDTGVGIPSEHLARIYDPFFTTKADGQGTGLGLSVTYGIVREHDGTLTCESASARALGSGSRFLAGARRERPARARAVTSQISMARHASILVIDDEEIMREAFETLLAREG